MKRVLWLFLLLLHLPAFAQPGASGTTYLSSDSLPNRLKENWLYHKGDNSAWASPVYNDSGWRNVEPTLSKLKNKDLDFDGMAWFRLHLYIDSTVAGQPLALEVRQAGASEIYLDGKKIHSFGKIGTADSNSTYYNPQFRPLVIYIDTPGKHLLAMRYGYFMAQGEYEHNDDARTGFEMTVQFANESIDDFAGRRMVIDLALLVMMCIFTVVGGVHLLLWMYRRRDLPNLYFSIFCIALGFAFVIPFTVLTSTNPKLTMWSNYAGFITAGVASIALSGVCNELFGGRSKLRFYIISGTAIVTMLLSRFLPDASALLMILVVLAVLVESFVLTIKAIYKKQRGARIVGVGILFFTLFLLSVTVLAIIKDGLYINDNSLEGVLFLLGLFAAILSIPVAMSVYLAWSFATMNRSLEKQLQQVQLLNEKTLRQEQEKKKILETQKEMLEQEVAARTREITDEKRKSDDLLLNILPAEVAEELKERGSTEARYYDHVTVMFTDFVDFTKAGERLTPQQLVDELDTCFKAFDHIISKYGIEKIKTIGDAYLAVCGLPAPVDDHAEKTVLAAMEILAFMQERKEQLPDRAFEIRIGIHSGSVVAGIVGVKKFAYDIWGDTVNTAARMEQSGEGGKVNISQATYELVKDKFNCIYRGEIEAKNKGEMRMYFVE